MAIIKINKISTDITNLGESNYFNRYWKNLDFDYLQSKIANNYDLEIHHDQKVKVEDQVDPNQIIEDNNSDSDIALGRIRSWYRGRELSGFSDNIDSYNEFNKINSKISNEVNNNDDEINS